MSPQGAAAEDGDNAFTQFLSNALLDEVRVIGAPFQSADGVKMEGEVAEQGQRLLIGRRLNKGQPDFRIDGARGADDVGVVQSLPSLHATVLHDEPAVERDGYCLLCRTGLHQDRLRGFACFSDRGHYPVD